MAFNQPKFRTENGQLQALKYSHQPITLEQFGVKASIAEDGKITFISGDKGNEKESVTIPASVAYKVTNLMRTVRKPNTFPPQYSSIAIEHHGTSAAITENGTVTLSRVGMVNGDEIELNTIDCPSELLFKIVTVLRATKKTTYVAVEPRDSRQMV